MAVLDRATLITNLLAAVTANGNNENTGQRVQDLLKDFLDSGFNLTDEAALLGFQEFSTGASYVVGQAVIYQQSIYQAHTANGPGAFNANNFTLIYTQDGASSFDFVPYDNGATYNVGDRVLYLDKFFICDVNGTQGVPPQDSAPEWTEVSANTGVFGTPWAAGYYLNGQVVSFNNKLYILDEATPPSYNSTDIAAEITAGDWLRFNGDSLPTGAENSFLTYDASGNIIETDEIKKDGAAILIKTLLKMAAGAFIEYPDQDGVMYRRKNTDLALENSFGGIYLTENLAFTGGFVGAEPGAGTIAYNDNCFSIGPAGTFVYKKAGVFYPFTLQAVAGQTLANLEDVAANAPITLEAENVTAATLLTGVLTPIVSASYTVGGFPGTYRVTFTVRATTSGDSVGNFGLYKNGVLEAGTFQSLGSVVSGGANGTSEGTITITKTLTGLVALDVIDIRAVLGLGATAGTDAGIFRVEFIP